MAQREQGEPSDPEAAPAVAETAGGEEQDGAEVEDALDLLFAGRVEAVLPPEELAEFHDFIREEAVRRRRFAVSFRLDCGCLAWIGYALSSIVTHEEGIEFRARATQSYIPDHEADVEHPEGPTEAPPEEFADWAIWPLEIYQDELEKPEHETLADLLDEASGDLNLEPAGDLADIEYRAAHEDPLRMDDYE